MNEHAFAARNSFYKEKHYFLKEIVIWKLKFTFFQEMKNNSPPLPFDLFPVNFKVKAIIQSRHLPLLVFEGQF